MPTPPRAPRSLRDAVVSGALWLMLTRWSHRVVGFVSTMVLARVLMPDDFGVVAAVMAVVAILDGFFEFGFDLALIRSSDASREDYDTAWTLRILKGLLFAALVVAVAPFLAQTAPPDEVLRISLVIGLSIVVRSLENIGTVRIEKELHYDRLFAMRLYPRLLGAATTIGLALVLRSYWAIVFGAALQWTYMTAFSYLMCDYRPRLRLQGAGKIWGFSKWILVAAVARQVFGAVDKLMLSGWVSTRELGFFTVTASLASMVTTELVGAVGTALVPGYAQIKDDRERLRPAYLASQAAYMSLLLPAAAGVCVLAPQLTAVVLGPQWVGAETMLAAFALFYLWYSVTENLNRFMAMTGLQEKAAVAGVVRTLAFVAGFYPVFRLGGIPALIGLKIGLSLVETLYLASRCCLRVGAPFGHYLRIFGRPLAACAAMAAAMQVHRLLPPGQALLQLAAAAPAGLLAYVGTLLALWHAAGRPAGLESTLVDMATRKGLLRRRTGTPPPR